MLIDPYASRVWLGYDFPRGIEADAVLITHPHYDHDGGRRRGGDVSWMSALTVWDGPGVYDLGDLRITGIEGKHAEPWGKEFGQKNTLWVVEVGGLRIAHLGDNGPLTPENVAALGRVDVLMAPIDEGEHILRWADLAAIRSALQPSILIPMHYRNCRAGAGPREPSGSGLDRAVDREGATGPPPGDAQGSLPRWELAGAARGRRLLVLSSRDSRAHPPALTAFALREEPHGPAGRPGSLHDPRADRGGAAREAERVAALVECRGTRAFLAAAREHEAAGLRVLGVRST